MYPQSYETEDYTNELDYDYQHDEYVEKSSLNIFRELYTYCVKPTVTEAYTNILILFASCAIFRLVTSTIKQPDTAHQISAAIGSYMLYIYFKWAVLHVLFLIIIGYLTIYISSVFHLRRGYVTCIILTTYLVSCEMFLVNYFTWQKIRGPQMIASMKIISVAFDLDNFHVLTVDVSEFLGYTLCLGTCVWGPWVPYKEYRAKQQSLDISWSWFVKCLYTALLSLVYFTTSVCWLEYFIPFDWGGWWIIYRDALSFRMSHYFVSSISETTATLTGFKNKVVCHPYEVELPRSLADVVIHWNLPTHKWLKTYIFKTTLHMGGFIAVMSTYLVSSLLHGLNIRLAAVLLSLGIYTYIEHSLRSKLAQRFSSCLASRVCPQPCRTHKHTSANLLVNALNILFSCLTIFHLAYLGVLMENSQPDQDHFARWQDQHYVSHWLILLTFLFNLLL